MTEEIRFEGTTSLKLSNSELTKLWDDFRKVYFGTFDRNPPQVRDPRALVKVDYSSKDYLISKPTFETDPEFQRIRKYLAKCNIHFRKMGVTQRPSFYLTGKSKLTVETLSKMYLMNEKYGIRIVRKKLEFWFMLFSPEDFRLAKLNESFRRITPFCKKATTHARGTFTYRFSSETSNFGNGPRESEQAKSDCST